MDGPTGELEDRSLRPLTGEFWAAVDREELVRPVCRDCDRSFFVPQFACPQCQSTNWAYEPSSGRGRVHSHTTVHRPPTPEFGAPSNTPGKEGTFDAPYVLADVDLEEGWHMLTWIVGCQPEDVSIDMAVSVRFVTGPDGHRLPAFAPDEAAR